MGPSAGDQLLKGDYPGTDPERRRASRSMAAERPPFLAVLGSHAARSVAKRGTQAAAAGVKKLGKTFADYFSFCFFLFLLWIDAIILP